MKNLMLMATIASLAFATSCTQSEVTSALVEQTQESNESLVRRVTTDALKDIRLYVNHSDSAYEQIYEQNYLSSLNNAQKEYLKSYAQPVNSTELKALDALAEASMLDPLMDIILNHAYTEDEEDWTFAINQYRSSSQYLSLPKEYRVAIDQQINLVSYIRLDIALLVKNPKADQELRMSPGDRMVWREAISNMTPCQREAAAKLTLSSIYNAFKGGGIGGVIKLIKSSIEYINCGDSSNKPVEKETTIQG